jgi:ubiquitin-protein ligase
MNGHQAHSRRRQEDIAKLKELASEFPGIIVVTTTSGNPVSAIELELNLSTAKNSAFPQEKQSRNHVQIQLPTRYPFDAPLVTLKTQIWNPNIFPNGTICLGKKWMPTENLALFVKRVMQILMLDPSVIDVRSPANPEAARWYSEIFSRNPALFPTENLASLKRGAVQKRIVWKSVK